MTGPVPSKVGTLAWFARRPVLWPQAARIVRQRLAPNRDAPKHELAAVAWCAERVISRDAALGQLGLARHHLSFDECMADLYLRALDRSRACPLSMGGPGDLTLLFSCAEGLAAERVLETGVAYGWSALPLLASLQARPGAVLHSVDMPYVEQNNDPYVGIVVPPELRRQWVLHRMADRRGIPRALHELGGAIDLCHYDSDKSYYGRRWAYPVLWNALRPGGIFISDDVGDNLAFQEFAQEIDRPPLVEEDGRYVGILHKRW